MSSIQSVTEVSKEIDIDKYLEDWIKASLSRNPGLARKINYVYRINITRNNTVFSSWILDLSSGKGSIYRNANQDVKSSVTLDEKDLMKALNDKSHWNTLFVKRTMVLKGTRVALEKLQQFWVEADQNKNQVRNSSNEHKALLDSIRTNGFKSDIIFYILKNRMHEEPDTVNKLSGIIQFDITKKDNKSIWTIDFTRPLSENVYLGPPMEKPTCILTMNDDDFTRMMLNKFNPQKAFMMGKLSVKGQILAMYKLFTVWIDVAFRKKRAPELPYIEQLLFDSDPIIGLKSETMVFEMIQRLVKQPKLCQNPGGLYYFDITKDGRIASKWKLDFTTNKECGLFSRLPIGNQSPIESLITIDDDDFVLMVLNKLNVEQAISSGRIKGDIGLASKLTQIFEWPLISSKL